MGKNTPYLIAGAVGVVALTASWYFLIYVPNHPKDDKKGSGLPPYDPNANIFNPPTTTNTTQYQPTAWNQIKVGDVLRAVGEVRLYDKIPSATGAKVMYTAKDNELVGKVNTIGTSAATVKNSLSGSTNPLYLASFFKVRKTY